MKKRTALLLLHFIVILWGMTSILGALISYDSVPLVWWRLVVVSATLFIYYIFSKRKLQLDKKLFLKIFFVGLIVGVHWLSFYAGIKTSNISITLIAFSSGTFFTAFIEPYLYKRKINKNEVFIGLAIFMTIGVIAINEMDTVKNPIWGLFFGSMAALTAALFSSFNGLLIKQSNAFTITFVELVSALFWVSLGMFLFFDIPENLFSPSLSDSIYILILAVLCTAIPFLISVEIMKQLTPFTINLSLNLEIVYSIIMAYFIFKEEEKMTTTFYVCAFIIVCLIVLNELVKKRKIKRQQTLN